MSKTQSTLRSDGLLVRAWKGVLFACWAHVLFIVPFKTGLLPTYRSEVFILLDLLCDIILVVNTFIMAPRIQTTIEGELVTDYEELRTRYYATKFYLDVTCSLPIDTVFEIYAYYFLPQDLSVELYLSILRLPKALLFVRLLESLNHVAVKLSTHINSAYIRIFSQLILIYMVTHWVGCAWVLYSHYYGFGSDEFVMSKEWEKRSLFAQYEYALFWGLRQMTGGDTGTGAPENRSERVFAVFISLAGLTVYASIISSLAAIVQHVTEEQNNIQDKLENLHNYLRRKQIPNNLRSRITKYMEYKLYHEQDNQEREVFDELPESLKADVILHMNKSLVAKVPFLTGCSEKIMHELILKLKPTVFAPNEYIFRATEVGHTMYFICKGQVEILSPEGDSIVTLGSGSFFGEMALLGNGLRSATVKSLTFCDTLQLSKEDLFAVAEHNGSFYKELEETAEKRRKEESMKIGKC